MGAELLFDPEKVKAEGDKSVEEMNKTLTQMQNEQAGFKLEVQKLDQEDLKKRQEQEKQAKENAEKLKNEQIKKDEEYKKQLEQNQKDFQDRIANEFENAKKISDDYFDHLINSAKINGEDTTNLELQKLQNQLQIQKDYAKNTIAIEDQIALKKKEIGDKLFEEQRKQFEKNKDDYSKTYSEIKTILDDAFAKKLISQKEHNDAVAQLDNAQLQGKIQFTKAVGDVLGAMSDLVGKQTKAGKVMATASALINTYLGISEVLKAKNPYPEPFGTAIKIANASVIGINGFKQVREINKVQIPNQSGGGQTGSQPSLAGASGSSPSMGAIGSQLSSATKIQLNQFENFKNPVVRAYVVESEVTGTQQRAKRLKQTSMIK
jgi:hypothetical protein